MAHPIVTQYERKLCYSSICSTVGLSVSDPGCLHRDHVTAIFGSMLSALENYTMDSRGDVGAW